MATEPKPLGPQPEFSIPDGSTVVAIAVLVYFLSTLIHEALGHGLAALLVGIHPTRVTAVDLEAPLRGQPLWKIRWVSAAGCIANGVTAVVAMVGWTLSGLGPRQSSGATRFFWWLLATVSLLVPGGYLMAGSAIGFGDWGQFEQGLTPLWAWKIGLTALGVAISLLGLWWGARHLGTFLPAWPARRKITWRLVLWPYLAGGAAAVAAGAMNPTSPVLIASSAAAASFGGTAWLLWIGGIASQGTRGEAAPGPAPGNARQRGSSPVPLGIFPAWRWRIAGLVALILYVGVLGPGLPR